MTRERDSARPDAALIRLCAAYRRAVAAYGAAPDRPGLSIAEQDAEDAAEYDRIAIIREHIRRLPAQTMLGIIAKAKVAMVTATMPDGTRSFDGNEETAWAEQVVCDLLRVHGARV